LLHKAVNNPGNLRFNEFQALLGHFDFILRKTIGKGKGSHEIYKQYQWSESISIQPLKDGKAKDYQVKQFVDILRRHNVI